jgi:hypothetical protein
MSTRRSFMRTIIGTTAGVSVFNQLTSLAFAAPATECWIRLFDGVSLRGWHKNREQIGHGTGGNWMVEEGAITGEQDPPGSGNGGVLLTDKKFKDFELLVDIRPDWGVCSGLFLRGTEMGQCIQMMVDYHNDGSVGELYGEGTFGWNTRTFSINETNDAEGNMVGLQTDKHKSVEEVGAIYACSPEDYVKTYRTDEWNTARVLVTGDNPRITTWINELKVGEFDGSTTTNETYKKNEAEILKLVGGAGSLGVQVHGGGGWPVGMKCRWKNLFVREL